MMAQAISVQGAASQFARDGFCITPPLLACAELARIDQALAPLAQAGAGTRNLLAEPWCAALAEQLRQHPWIAPLLAPQAVAVQCLYFEKSQEHNWLVPLHQDLGIPVARRVEHPKLRGWSEKEGTTFVQPPDALLAQLSALRLHIDDCGGGDGALRVVPGSHLLGRLSNAQAQAARGHRGEILCPVAPGAAMVLRPLLLHASSKSPRYTQIRSAGLSRSKFSLHSTS